ncbi:MAG: hypothetical protein PQJ46_03610 [Spirochaetales bacterium]|nr:hypothetical protein [Spirochaetales bacterium]
MKPDNIFIEKFRLNEITEDEMKILEEEFSDEQELKVEVDKIKASDTEILEKYKPKDVALAIESRIKVDDSVGLAKNKKNILFFTKAVKITSIAAAAVLVFIFGFSFYKPATSTGNWASSSDVVSTERVKGLKPSLEIYRRVGDDVEMLSNRAHVSARDLLQIEYIAGSSSYGVIFSIDGRGLVTLHYPLRSGVVAKLDTDGAVLLPYSYELDDAPGFERFFFVAGGAEFDIDKVLYAAYTLASHGSAAKRGFLDIPENYYQTTILLRKGAN